MANNKSAKKRIRIAERNRIRNKGFKTKLKNSMKEFDNLLKEGKIEEATLALSIVQKSAGKAASKGSLHKNAAARKVAHAASKLKAIAPEAKATKAVKATKTTKAKKAPVEKKEVKKVVKKAAVKKTTAKKSEKKD